MGKILSALSARIGKVCYTTDILRSLLYVVATFATSIPLFYRKNQRKDCFLPLVSLTLVTDTGNVTYRYLSEDNYWLPSQTADYFLPSKEETKILEDKGISVYSR